MIKKALKIILFSFLAIFIVGYLAFLFILPSSIDLNKYIPQITKAIQDETGFGVQLQGLKVKTSWNLSAGSLIDKTDLLDPTGKKFAQINGLQVRLSLVPLIFNKIEINKVDMDKLLLNVDVDQEGKIILKEFFAKTTPKKSGKYKIVHNMPDISAKKYRISFLSGANKYSLKGEDLKVSDFILDKKIKIKTKGEVVLNGRKQITYNIAIFSKAFAQTKQKNESKNNIISIFNDLYKYNVQANINTNLKITKKDDIIDTRGKINLDKISFTIGGTTIPQSNLNLDFTGERARISSVLYSDLNSKINISGWLKQGKHKSIDLEVASDKINIENIILIAKTMSKTFAIKNLNNISANGYAKANFSIKSDFKKIESDGYLKIKDATIKNKLYNVALDSVNADIDFSQDSIKIKRATANLNSQPIIINGTIDKKANADIDVFANNLQLKGALLTFGKANILKENDILGGVVNVKACLKGKLDKTSPKINVLVKNVNIKNKASKTQITIAKASIIGNKEKAAAEFTNLKVVPKAPAIISAPKINLSVNPKDITINPAYLYLNNVKTTLSGKISGINKAPKLNSVTVSIPNQISVPISGYPGSNIIVKGNLILNGDLSKPDIQGGLNIPLIRIPSTMTVIKNSTLQFGKEITLNCPQVQIADSNMGFTAQIENNANGITAKNVNLIASNINLNSINPLSKNIQKGSCSNQTITISSGKSKVGRFRVGNMVSNNLTSNLSMKNNMLYLDNVRGDAYFGKIGGDIIYDLRHKRTILNLQGRGLNANQALSALIGKSYDINGTLDFDGNVSLRTGTKSDMLNSLKGYTNFIISNGQMGMLGKFEHLIYAQNVISNNVFKTSLNIIAKAVSVKNTGVYKYMKGKITLSEGWANINSLKTSGPSMSLYITGRYNLIYNTANLTMLGRISADVVRILGPIGEFSMDKVISRIPKIGAPTSALINQYTTNPNYENTSQIPYLTPRTEFPTREFKVIIDGDVSKQSSVRSFKWISSPKATTSETSITTNIQNKEITAKEVPEFVKNLPDLKN